MSKVQDIKKQFIELTEKTYLVTTELIKLLNELDKIACIADELPLEQLEQLHSELNECEIYQEAKRLFDELWDLITE